MQQNPSLGSCEGVACTMDFRSITPSIIDSPNSIVIQKTETILNGGVILTQDSSNVYNGYYLVIDDSNIKDLNFRKEAEVFFIEYIVMEQLSSRFLLL